MLSNEAIYSRWARLFSRLLKERETIRTRSERALARVRRKFEAPSATGSNKRADPIATPVEASDGLCGEVADLLHARGIPFFALPPASGWDDKWHIVIGGNHRNAFLRACAEVEGPDRAFRFVYREDPRKALGFSPSAHLDTLAHRIGSIIRISIGIRQSEALYGGIDLDYPAVQVEFWTEDESGSRLNRTGHNPYLPSFDLTGLDGLDSVEMGGAGIPVFGLGKTVPWWKCRFPIDVVYTWVDGNDADFRRAKARYLSEWKGQSSDGAGVSNDWEEHRFLSRDELRYSLRSVNAYMPWVRKIHIVTNGQVPAWLRTEALDGRLILVEHKDIFPTSEHLPTFNSHAIEANLHRIKGLSEHFLYFNDDVFVGSPQYPEDFFLPNGSTRFFPSSTMVDPLFAGDEAYVRASRNSNRILTEEFNLEPVNSMLHVPHALNRTILAEITERHAAALERTSAARFRSDGDLNLTSFLHHYYAYGSGRAVPSKCRARYIGLGAPNCGQQLFDTISARFDFLCVGDAPVVSRMTELDFAQAMERLFPWASPWEIGVL